MERKVLLLQVYKVQEYFLNYLIELIDQSIKIIFLFLILNKLLLIKNSMI